MNSRALLYFIHMADLQEEHFDRLEALISGLAESLEKGFAVLAEDVADTQIKLMEIRHKIEVKDTQKDTQIAALLERVKEYVITAKALEKDRN